MISMDYIAHTVRFCGNGRDTIRKTVGAAVGRKRGSLKQGKGRGSKTLTRQACRFPPTMQSYLL
jgi:hypothetical protein